MPGTDCHSEFTRTSVKTIEPRTVVCASLDEVAQRIHKTAVEKGFWDDGLNEYVYMTKLALVHSEVTEILEAVRKSQGDEAELEEIADVIIRLLDYYEGRKKIGVFAGLSLDHVLEYKLAKNEGRPFKHNNKF